MSRKGKNLQLLSTVELIRCESTGGSVTEWEVWCDATTVTTLHGALGKKEGESV